MAFHTVQISILNMKNINGGLAGEMRKTKPLRRSRCAAKSEGEIQSPSHPAYNLAITNLWRKTLPNGRCNGLGLASLTAVTGEVRPGNGDHCWNSPYLAVPGFQQ
jgi:hypothetical protein